jgi:hypothetical protein
MRGADPAVLRPPRDGEERDWLQSGSHTKKLESTELQEIVAAVIYNYLMRTDPVEAPGARNNRGFTSKLSSRSLLLWHR